MVGIGIVAAIGTVGAKEAGNGFLLALKNCGVDLRDAKSIERALSDPQIMYEARILAAAREVLDYQ